MLAARLRLLLVCSLMVAATGCANTFQFRDLAKSDIDYVADAHLQSADELLQELLRKLYLRNPAQLERAARPSTVEARIDALFSQPGPYRFAELDHREGAQAVLLGLDPAFRGDRVFAVMTGLTAMIHSAYGYRAEFFLFDELDGQRLYNSARNVEILVWRLNHRTGADGELLLLTNSNGEETQNLSFERLFGKLIAVQDLLATITSQRTRRTISKVAQGIATSAFLP